VVDQQQETEKAEFASR